MKTLKELNRVDWDGDQEKDPYLESWVRIRELRAEAIKWVKEDFEEDSHDPYVGGGYFIAKWMKRFNITEEELSKEGEA